MRKKRFATIILVYVSIVLNIFGQKESQTNRINEIDQQLWKEVSRSVREGDFEGYKATCHENAILVVTTGQVKESYPISKALDRWKQGFINTKEGKQFDRVEFRFSQRIGDENTAHETGMFYFNSKDKNGKSISDGYIHFEALLIKEGQRWKILMEYQKKRGTIEEWESLK